MKTNKSGSGLLRSIGVSLWLWTAIWPSVAATNLSPHEVSETLERLQGQLEEQTRRIDRLYKAIGPHLAELEERAAALEKQQQEDKALGLETICRVPDESLSGIGANSFTTAEFGALTTSGTVRIYNPRGEVVKEVEKPGTVITCLAFSPTGKDLLVGTQSGALLIWDYDKGTHSVLCTNVGIKVDRVTWLGPDRVAWGAYQTYWGNDGKPVDQDKPAGAVLDRRSGQKLWSFRGFVRNDFNSLAGAMDGEQLAVMEIPGQPRGAFLLEKRAGDMVKVCYDEQHGSGPLSVGLSPTGDLLAVGYAPYDIVLWKRSTGERLKLLSGHSNWVVSLAFSMDGKKLISGAGDSTARVWDLEGGNEIGRIRFPGESAYVDGVGFSPKGDVCFAVVRGLFIAAKAPVKK